MVAPTLASRSPGQVMGGDSCPTCAVSAAAACVSTSDFERVGVELQAPSSATSAKVPASPARAVTGRAIPSISPAASTAFVKKTQCFCFEQQTLKAGQVVDMPVVLYIDPALPESIKTITLAYRFYRQPDAEQKI